MVAGSAAADDPDRDAVGLDQSPGLAEAFDGGDRLRPLLLARPRRQDVSLVAHDAGQANAGRGIDRARQLEGSRSGLDTGPVHADVDVDDERQVDARIHPDPRGELDVIRVVGAEHHLGPVLKSGRGFDLLARRELVRDEDARDAALDHDLGFGDLRAGDADGAMVHLPPGDPR